MDKDNVILLGKPDPAEDILTKLLKQGARELINQAVQAELGEFLAFYQDSRDERGCVS